MLSILLISGSPTSDGGIGKWTLHITNYFSKIKSVRITLIPVERKKYLCQFFKYIDDVFYYSLLIIRISIIIKRNKFHIIHLCSSASKGLIRDKLIIRMAHRRGIKVVVHFHFGRIPQLRQIGGSEWDKLLQVITEADKTIVMDKFSYSALVSHGCSKISYIPNPLADSVLKLIDENKIDHNSTHFVFVGHVIKTKGVIELVEACKDIDDISLTIIGAYSDSMKNQLQSIVRSQKLENNIRFTGILSHPDVIKAMCTAGLFVLPTYTEGFPNVIIEAMACGCPIISTPVGAIPDMLDIDSSAPCGICVDARDVEQLRNAIIYLRDNRDKALRLGENAYKRVREQYSIESVGNQLLDTWRMT